MKPASAYNTDGKPKISEDNCDKADDEYQDGSIENVLLENYNSLSRPELKHEQGGDAKSPT